MVFPPFSLAFHADAVAAVVHYPLEVCIALHFQSIGRAKADKKITIRVHPVSLIVAVLKGRNPVLELVCAVKVAGPTQDEREHHYYGSDESPHDSLILFTSFEGGLEISQVLSSIDVVSLHAFFLSATIKLNIITDKTQTLSAAHPSLRHISTPDDSES